MQNLGIVGLEYHSQNICFTSRNSLSTTVSKNSSSNFFGQKQILAETFSIQYSSSVCQYTIIISLLKRYHYNTETIQKTLNPEFTDIVAAPVTHITKRVYGHCCHASDSDKTIVYGHCCCASD